MEVHNHRSRDKLKFVTVFNPPATRAATFHLHGMTWCLLYCYVSKKWYGCQCLGFLACAQMFLAWDCTRGMHEHCKRVCAVFHIRKWNLLQQCAEPNTEPTELRFCPMQQYELVQFVVAHFHALKRNCFRKNVWRISCLAIYRWIQWMG